MNPKVEQLLVSALHKLEADGRPVPHNRWQRALSKTVTTLVPAFHQSPWMEWEYGTWVGVFAGYDEVGRQLGEANVLPEWRATPLADHWRPFKGPGSRNGHPFNVDAMHEMVHCWDDLLLDAATLQEIYCRFHHSEQRAKNRLSALDLYIMTTVAVSLSSFLLRRGNAPTRDGALPRQVAAAFKVIGGMYAATNRMISQAHPLLMQDELDVEAFLQYLEDERLLLSPEMRACAGPVKMIRQILTAIIDPTPDDKPTNGLAYLGDDLERAVAYGLLCARIDLGVLLYWRSLGSYLRPLLEQSTLSPGIRDMLLQEAELGLEDPVPLQAYIAVAGKALNLLTDTAPEQAFMAALPHPEQALPQDPATLGASCYQLELAMRALFSQQQINLDTLLQRQSPPHPRNAWSPAPCSTFLKELFATYPALATAL
ncbi:hypothetical protein [Thiothrix lacustris]|uniref:hypothetical protein n=1 Tax=Thiothrix lacustris TaxID=525917 RepID=UPI0027E4ED36|nr:hypothetical protein [Thiothrix lacustris]WMP19429.1 hypothetical protein RCS87_19845 [Thiothrix lacustris]